MSPERWILSASIQAAAGQHQQHHQVYAEEGPDNGPGPRPPRTGPLVHGDGGVHQRGNETSR